MKCIAVLCLAAFAVVLSGLAPLRADCSGSGPAGSASRAACERYESAVGGPSSTFGARRTPDFGGLDAADRMAVERGCQSLIGQGSAYDDCVKTRLVLRQRDPSLPLRPLPETQRVLQPEAP